MRDQLDAVIRTLGDFRLRALMSKCASCATTARSTASPSTRSTSTSWCAARWNRSTCATHPRRGKAPGMDGTPSSGEAAPALAGHHEQVVRLRQKNLLTLSRIDGLDPYYRTMGGV